jgi:predicted amidohydrolase
MPGTTLGQWRQTLALLEDMVRAAAEQGAELLVLPECAWPAYVLGSRRDYFEARAEGLPRDREILERAGDWARRRRIALCLGHVQEIEGRLRNAATLFDPDGRPLGTHHKCFLWDFDHQCYDPGDEIRPIAGLPVPVGVMICADARLPEIAATLAARGAQLIAQPTAWVCVGDPAALWSPQADFLIRARAREFGVPIASASKWGVEGGTTFVGRSLICDADGVIVAQCGPRETRVLTADVATASPRVPGVSAAERRVLLGALTPLSGPPAIRLRMCATAPRGETDDALPTVIASLAPDSPSPPHPGVLHLRPDHSAAQVRALRGVGVAALHESTCERFAPARCAALAGALLLVVWGDGAAPYTLRARALENRIYLARLGPAGCLLLDPGGRTVLDSTWESCGGQAEWRLDLSAARTKQVAGATDVFAGRRVEQYEFAPAPD